MRFRLLQPYILRMEFRVFPSIFARNGINGITKSLSKYPQKTDYTTAQKLVLLSLVGFASGFAGARFSVGNRVSPNTWCGAPAAAEI